MDNSATSLVCDMQLSCSDQSPSSAVKALSFVYCPERNLRQFEEMDGIGTSFQYLHSGHWKAWKGQVGKMNDVRQKQMKVHIGIDGSNEIGLKVLLASS